VVDPVEEHCRRHEEKPEIEPQRPILDAMEVRSHASDGANGVFFLGRRSDVTIEPRDVVSAYRGVRS